MGRNIIFIIVLVGVFFLLAASTYAGELGGIYDDIENMPDIKNIELKTIEDASVMDKFDTIVGELILTAMGLFALSVFISSFDQKTSRLLRQVALLNGVSVLLIVSVKIYVLFSNLVIALDNISKMKLLDIFK